MKFWAMAPLRHGLECLPSQVVGSAWLTAEPHGRLKVGGFEEMSVRLCRATIVAVVGGLVLACGLAGCSTDATESAATAGVTAETDLLRFSPEWCLRRQADLASGKLQPEPGAEKLRVDGICSATLQTKDQPLR
jgi:hypothetical protein